MHHNVTAFWLSPARRRVSGYPRVAAIGEALILESARRQEMKGPTDEYGDEFVERAGKGVKLSQHLEPHARPNTAVAFGFSFSITFLSAPIYSSASKYSNPSSFWLINIDVMEPSQNNKSGPKHQQRH